MLVPLSWLGDYVPLEMPLAELVERLTISTAQVGRVAHHGVPDTEGNLDLFRVGRVLEAGKHPNADRLQLCRVDVGEGEPRQIVCGAWNFGAGATVAVALPGAVLPGGARLEHAKLRGETSDGMILSERELEIGHDHTGILVLDSGEPGAPLVDVLPLHDIVIDVETTPNRPDLLSVYGLAREVAALWKLELAPPPGLDPKGGGEPVDVTVEDLERCPRYLGRTFRDVRVGPSPPWMKARLTAAGMRPISNVVDVTNYVMLALGNPLHAFDQDKLRERRIVVRRARKGEPIRTLDGALRELDPWDLVIADAEVPVGIGGIMGSEDSEVDDSTTDVLLEAANFEPYGILKSSERLGLRSEGSNRWEKGVDPYLAEQAAVYATELFVAHADARWVGETDIHDELPPRPVARLRPERASALNGLEVQADEQRGTLERLGFGVDGDLQVTVPTWRARDVTREIDLVEEVARTVLDRVPYTLPARREMFGRLSQVQRLRRAVEDTLVGIGFSEVYTPSLVPAGTSPDGYRLPAPLTSELAELRTTLGPSLVEAARHNVDAGNAEIALFEIARVYLPGPEEPWHAGGIAQGDFAFVKGAVETLCEALHVEPRFSRAQEDFLHPGRAARIRAGWLGELHPSLLEGTWSAFELDLELLFADVPERIVYEDVVSYPALRQDLAFVVDEAVEASALVDAAREAAGPELRALKAFDVYRGPQVGEGKKSIAFAATFQSPERTLSDEDAARLRERIVAALREQFGAELRA